MKEIGGNFIDFDSEDEDGRCSSFTRRSGRSLPRYIKHRLRRRTLKRVDSRRKR
jgi:hypothetical protein